MKLPVSQARALGLILFASASAVAGLMAAPLLGRAPVAAAPQPGGPAADYPMVLGPAAVIDGMTYTPSDTMNYDQVGYAAIDAAAGPGITLAHRTLPLPSYVEVTSLKTGRTILVRAERRGPMSGHEFVALSPGAAAQLGAEGRTAVRVRRVNPPEAERALLRAGQVAPMRMDTPMSLVGVLQRKLDPPLPAANPAPDPATATTAVANAPAGLPVRGKPANATPPAPGKPPRPGKPPIVSGQGPAMGVPAQGPMPATQNPAATARPVRPAPPKAAATAPAAAPAAAPRAAAGKVIVQVGAFSSRANAERAARQVGGAVLPVGKLFRVRITGFGTPAQASSALAKARSAGYSDARIQRAD